MCDKWSGCWRDRGWSGTGVEEGTAAELEKADEK